MRRRLRRAWATELTRGIPLRSILTLAVAGFVAIAALAPASAATRHKTPIRSEAVAAAAQHVEHPEVPAAVSAQPGACFTDEGYGYASCDQAGF